MIKPVKWKTRLELLSAEEVRAIHEASLRILECTGLEMPLSKVRQEQARDLGLAVDEDAHRVRFSPRVVEAALHQAPRSYTLCARDPENDLGLDSQHGYLSLDGSGTDVLDFQCSVSPLAYDASALEAAFVFGVAGIPTGFMNMTIGAGTAPATVAGNAAVANAEVLAGIVLFELFCPGVPTFYGSCATMMELHSGSVTAGGPEDFLLQAVGCQMARFYGVPSCIGTFATGAKTNEWHAGVDNALSGAVSQFSGADMMCGAGLLNGARIFSFEQLVMDCEIYDMLRAVVQGFPVNEETLAVEAVHATGPRSHFMKARHTKAHVREAWQPSVIDRTPWDEWVKKGRPTTDDNARQKAKQILASHVPEPLPCADRIREIIAVYERSI